MLRLPIERKWLDRIQERGMGSRPWKRVLSVPYREDRSYGRD